MFTPLLENLSTYQKQQLRDAGISDQMRSDWKYDRRVPTEAELLILADVASTDVKGLLHEIADKRAKPANRAALARAMGKLKRGAGVTLSFGVAAVADSVAWGLERITTMYRAQNA